MCEENEDILRRTIKSKKFVVPIHAEFAELVKIVIMTAYCFSIIVKNLIYLAKTFLHLSGFHRHCCNGTIFMEHRIFYMKKALLRVFFFLGGGVGGGGGLKPLFDIFEKGVSFSQKEQYDCKVSFFSFSYFFLLTFTQFIRFHLSHGSH